MPSGKPHTYDYIKSFFKEQGCVLLSNKYINSRIKLNYICDCGNESSITFDNFKQGHRCKLCQPGKSKAIKMKRYGDPNYVNKEKQKKTMIERYGVEHSLQVPEIFEKAKQTTLKRYGVRHPLQNTEIFTKAQKTGFRRKKIVTPSGKTIQLQGYEPQVYKMLLEKYNEDEIKHRVEDKPKVWYDGIDNKGHKYYPDFFIPKDNLILEVKSTYFYLKDQEMNLLKQQACIDAGYNHDFIILNKKFNQVSQESLL